jgi:HSP20 family molecular chaperone IbpA
MAALMPRLFGDVNDWFESEFPLRAGHMIRVEDFLTEHEYLVRAELPGLDPEEGIQVTVNEGVLTISGERREEEQTRTRSEFRYGMFHRAVRLPANADVDKIAARYAKGVLEVKVPLTAPEPTGRQIPVTKGE